MSSTETRQHRSTIRDRITEKVYQQPAKQPCTNPCASNSFVEWREINLTPSFNYELNFGVPAGKQAVIELITATIEVPIGEWVRIRFYTSIGSAPGNFDLTVVPQGNVNGQTIFIATHPLKVYTDSLLAVNINRDNDTTSAYALVCIGGYLLG